MIGGVASTNADPGGAWEGLPLPALLLDREGHIEAMNEAAEAFLNLSRRAAIGQCLDTDPLRSRLRLTPPLSALAAQIVDGGEAMIEPLIRVEIGDRTGGQLTRHATAHLRQREGSGVSIVLVPGTHGVSSDNAARRGARSALGMAEMLTHEIKNPLAGIRGAAQLIGLELGEHGTSSELVDLIVDESRRIVALLDQVERFGDTSPPRLAPVNLHDVLERARRTTELAFGGLRIATDYDPSLPQGIADADLLTQVVLNLLRNAAEALQRGHVAGSIRLRSFYDGGLRRDGRALPLQIEIEDDGPGIPEAIAAQVFEPFVSGRENGTGLGLALVAKIVADHGAWIGVHSRPGRTVFRVALRRA